eukprot:scaffold240983_cov30-Tisochrysis_lutea.AAC.1
MIRAQAIELIDDTIHPGAQGRKQGTQRVLADERSKPPLKHLPQYRYRQLRREDLHSEEFFSQLKARKWRKANIAEIYRTKKWDNPTQLEHDTATTYHEIRRKFRRYYVVGGAGYGGP